ncbi:TetR/AcrR family transcriptional regulator [Acetivibrio cellulolyticus]|uniref:TetR/AcrR family transcriptional regulator n=1 Tax=Acetivibrio cellulolyticus TaxID=35830 RepID=UPI0001E2FB75|nr:TetR/AcrR family transcriptional regulator [Acetivibrio cellulolyticus]
MTTKDKIMFEALSLFSVHGYSSVSVRDITKAIGIRESAIYKHYKNKQAIFDTIIQVSTERVNQLQQELIHSFGHEEQDDSNFSVDIQKIYCRLFEFYLTDDILSKFRKMMIIEQYKSVELNAVFIETFMEKTLRYQTKVFQQLISEGRIDGADPEIMALQFYSPVMVLLLRYDAKTEKIDEALNLIAKHVQEFFRLYLK